MSPGCQKNENKSNKRQKQEGKKENKATGWKSSSALFSLSQPVCLIDSNGWLENNTAMVSLARW